MMELLGEAVESREVIKKQHPRVQGSYHSLKSDLMKHVDDLDLAELLDDSYTYSNSCPARGKKSSSNVANENILLSIRKVISILPPPCAASATANNDKATNFPSDISNCDKKDSATDESVSVSKGPYQESCTLFNDSKEILQHLALPPGLVLDSLLDPNTNSVLSNALQIPSQNASLPSFPWSSSHVGSCKSNSYNSKQVSARNLCPARWYRIENGPFSLKDYQNYLVDLKVEALPDKGVTHKKHEDTVIHFLDSSKLSYDDPASKVQPAPTSPACVRSSDIGSSGITSERLLNVPMDVSFTRWKYDQYGIGISRTSDEESPLRNWQNDSPIRYEIGPAIRASETGNCHKDQHTKKSKGYSIGSCFYREDISIKLERSSRNSRDICKTDNSPRVLLAAEILFEMANCSKTAKFHMKDYRRIKLSMPPLYKTMKAPKFLCSVQRSESFFSKTKHRDNDRISDSFEKRPNRKRGDFKYIKSKGRDHIRWPASLDYGISPCKLEKNVQVSQQPSHNVSVTHSSLISSKRHLEQDVNNQEKLTKKTIVAAANRALIKDCNKGRSKRV